ncbi:MAG: hypothetical protein GXP62_10810 [Oligoflexia bacterium]|nr:hypothetical protein [Oligoflexia bacterium]
MAVLLALQADLLLALSCAQPGGTLGGTKPWTDPGVAPLVEGTPDSEQSRPLVLINELMADNESTLDDEAGEEDDWLELVGTGDAAVVLGGYGLGPDADGPTWTVPMGTTLQPGQHLVLWLDEQAEQGPLHLPFKLPASGGSVVLFGPADRGSPVLDAWTFGAQDADVVLGRFPDGGANIAQSIVATPGNSNPFDPGQSTDPTDLLFVSDRVLTIEIGLPEASLAALAADSTTYVEGSVSFGAVTLAPVGVHIKGQWGSKRTMDQKAALKVNMHTFGGTAELKGLGKLTLNNMVQDYSLVHEREAYTLFTDLGVPAPRTSYVALSINGEYRGIYLNVESPDDRFLARWFDDAQGNLYEGEYGQDLTLDSYEALDQDQQGQDDVDDRSDLLALATLLAEDPDESLVPQLESLVDIDELLRAMAVEVAIGHWDGYFWYPNNYRFYHDPSTGLFSLLPWGVDQTFDYDGNIEVAGGALGVWCLAVPSLRARYLREVWRAADRMDALRLDEDAAVAHAMVLPYLVAGPFEETTSQDSTSSLRSTVAFIQDRPATLMTDLFP